MKLTKWTKPGTNEVRIYINDCGLFDKKPFIIKNDSGNWEIKCFGAYLSEIDHLYDTVESHFNFELGASFDELLSKIKDK